MTDPGGAASPESIEVALTMRDMAIIRESLTRTRDALRAAVAPFGLNTTWDAETRISDVLATITTARCDMKRRHPAYNPAGDSECEGEATDEERDRWDREHPEPKEPTE